MQDGSGTLICLRLPFFPSRHFLYTLYLGMLGLLGATKVARHQIARRLRYYFVEEISRYTIVSHFAVSGF